MSNIGAPLAKQKTAISPDVFNAKTRSMLTGIQIFNLSPTYAGQGVYCIEDGEGFIVNHRYSRNADNNKWLDEGVIIHRHDDETDASGGSLQQIFVVNDRFFYMNPFGMTGEQWLKSTQGTGAVLDVASGIELNTGNTANGHIDLGVNGGQISMNDICAIFMHYYALQGSRMTIKWGVGMNFIFEAETVVARFGLEACDNVGTEKNFSQISADGNFWTGEPTSVPVKGADTDGNRGLKLLFTPAASVVLSYSNYRDNSRTTKIKTTNIPIGGRWGNRAYKVGWTNNENAEKRLAIYNTQVIGYYPAFYW